jgi:hypothetical protein
MRDTKRITRLQVYSSSIEVMEISTRNSVYRAAVRIKGHEGLYVYIGYPIQSFARAAKTCMTCPCRTTSKGVLSLGAFVSYRSDAVQRHSCVPGYWTGVRTLASPERLSVIG